MPRFIYDTEKKEMVEVFDQPRQPPSFPSIMGDTPEYLSPMEPGRLISGRAERREEMKRHNVREVDPSEKPKPPVMPDHVKDWRAGRGITRSKPNE